MLILSCSTLECEYLFFFKLINFTNQIYENNVRSTDIGGVKIFQKLCRENICVDIIMFNSLTHVSNFFFFYWFFRLNKTMSITSVRLILEKSKSFKKRCRAIILLLVFVVHSFHSETLTTDSLPLSEVFNRDSNWLFFFFHLIDFVVILFRRRLLVHTQTSRPRDLNSKSRRNFGPESQC